MSDTTSSHVICVVGLGYVGLPLAVEFGKQFRTFGFDINEKKVNELKEGVDKKCGLTKDDFAKAPFLEFIFIVSEARCANIYIITVPTPVNRFKSPDLSFLLQASALVGSVLKKGDIVIYESTVYPGCTEEDCVPVLEKRSGLMFNKDFFCGYSPERINPGDTIHTLTNIKKVTSGSTPVIADAVDRLYQHIIVAGTHRAPSIKVAETSKAIENAQRDINISFFNELALICDRIGIDTTDVIEAASTKWNFLTFKPGLVGGHCVGVDPYYLAHKAESLGYHPQVILSGRRVNDSMGMFVANKVVKLLIQRGVPIKGASALLLGITFKENCADFRNTKVIDIYHELQEYGVKTDIVDPVVDASEIEQEYRIHVLSKPSQKHYDAVILAVAHRAFFSFDFASFKKQGAIIYDVKACLNPSLVDGRL